MAAFDAGVTEGVDFRVGGGYNYCLKIQDVWNNYSDWTATTISDKAARAAISKAVGQFGMGTGVAGAWKETYTDRCIEIDKWTHMVATWDGTNMLIFLDGHNATDSWRTVGSGMPAFVSPVRTVVMGAEHATSAWRHFNGKIGYVKVYNQVLSPCEVWHKYKESLGDQRCVRFIRIESPHCGEVITRDTRVKFSVRDSLDNEIPYDGFSFTVSICHKPTFTDTVHSFLAATTDCSFGDLTGADNCNLDGLLYFRVSACSAGGVSKRGLNKTADDDLAAESGTLPALLTGSPSRVIHLVTPSTSVKKVTSMLQLTNEVVFDIRGRKVGVGPKAAYSPLKCGIYIIKTANGTNERILYQK